jgi:hypothetical protein
MAAVVDAVMALLPLLPLAMPQLLLPLRPLPLSLS